MGEMDGEMDGKMEKRRRRVAWGAALAVVVGMIVGVGEWYGWFVTRDFANGATVYIQIEEGEGFDALCVALQDSAHCKDIRRFRRLARLLKYPSHIHAGRYAVEPGMRHLALLNRLRRGEQSALRLTFGNVRLMEDLAEQLSEQLSLSAESLLMLLQDTAYCCSLGFSPSTVFTMFIPNTYEVYWNVTAAGLLQRMKREYELFWTAERRAQAAGLGLTPTEVSILASIVEEETAAEEEYSVVAGLYLNRLRRGMLLQADPSVKYAVGDFSLQRILYRHTAIDSPYNTYKHAGLPPGPLRLPSMKGLDGVLNAAAHKYIYMCAKEDFSGRHNFAETLLEHNRNARRYHAALNRRRRA